MRDRIGIGIAFVFGVALALAVVATAYQSSNQALAQASNPDVTIDHVFNWAPPSSGTAVKYLVAVDDPSGTQLAPPGTVTVNAPATSVALSTFLTGQPLADGYAIYVRAEDAGGNQSGFLTQLFDYVGITAPEPAPDPFTLP